MTTPPTHGPPATLTSFTQHAVYAVPVCAADTVLAPGRPADVGFRKNGD